MPIEERTDKQFYKIFFIWFSCNFNILSFVLVLRPSPFILPHLVHSLLSGSRRGRSDPSSLVWVFATHASSSFSSTHCVASRQRICAYLPASLPLAMSLDGLSLRVCEYVIQLRARGSNAEQAFDLGVFVVPSMYANSPHRTTWGPKLGLRQMCQARYSFGCVISWL